MSVPVAVTKIAVTRQRTRMRLAHHLGKPLDLGVGMLRGEGEPQPRGALRHRRRPDGDDQEAFGPRAAARRRAPPRASPITTGTIGLCRLRQAGGARKRLRLGERQRRVGGIALDQVERGDGGGDRSRAAGRSNRSACGRGCGSGRSPAPRRRDSRHSRRAPWTACPSAAARRPAAMREGRAAPAADHAEAVGVVGHQPGVVGAAPARESAGSGARSPSIENTPSVTISARGWRRDAPTAGLRHGPTSQWR